MGFHVCEYCQKATSSGDVTLHFASGHSYIMPDMIKHYVRDHTYRPPEEFIEDVMSGTFATGELRQTRGLPTRVGYLSGAYPIGVVPDLFVFVLEGMMARAAQDRQRVQTRGATSLLENSTDRKRGLL